MALIFELLRPDDLLALRIEARNLKLDTADPKHPKLVIDRKGKPAYLIVKFPPQSITEKAYFETAPKLVPGPPGDDPLDAAGSVPTRMAGTSRLVFRLPSQVTEIPYDLASLLDWSKLDLVLSPVALGGTATPPITAPGALQTAIEMPYRLLLSPGTAGVGWAHATVPETYQGRTELWHTRIGKIKVTKSKGNTVSTLVEASETNSIPLRAIWSPDFVDHAPLPLMGDEGPFLMAMSPRDRAEIVILTSGTLGYYLPGVGTPSGPWTPQPVKASRLFLSALGGWLTSAGTWSPLPSFTASDGTTQSLELSEWRHIATQARDHYVKIVYEGYLYPFGHRAALIKVTERKVVPPDGGVVTNPTAYLKQHMYIVVREKEKAYPTATFAHSGREMPFWQNITVKTVVTPDIDKPGFFAGSPSSFWINVDNAGFPFHMQATDLAGATVNFLAQLIFMADSEPNPVNLQAIYRGSGTTRQCSVHGQKVAYADPAAGDTILKTTGLFFDTQLFVNQPPYPVVPYFPFLDQAAVTVPVLEQILGTTTPTTIELYGGYLNSGLDAHAGVFAAVAGTPPAITFSAEKSGGFATPNLTMTALSARKGLVAGSPDDAAAGLIDPSAFFGDLAAKLFGTVPLSGLIPTTGGKANADVNAPVIRTHLEPNSTNPTSFQATLDWSPDLQDYKQDPVHVLFQQSPKSALTLSNKIVKSLTGGPSTSEIKGELSNFTIDLLQVVQISMNSLTFSSKNGEKTNVKADLPASNPIQFEGALGFVQKLAEILPPGIFGGSGPSISLQPSQIVVSLSIGLPPLSVGVFSLENISITTGLDLPYLDGKPGFEFAFAKRSSPFLLLVECLGGGGFIHLVINADGVQMVEGALEFGGQFSIDLGVASGGVHVMAGIYFKLDSTSTTVTGFVDIGGEVSVLGIISISIDLNLSLTYQETNGKKMIQGRATLTISVHIIFFSISVSVSVEKSFGNTAGDPKVAQVIAPADWAAYAAAFA